MTTYFVVHQFWLCASNLVYAVSQVTARCSVSHLWRDRWYRDSRRQKGPMPKVIVFFYLVIICSGRKWPSDVGIPTIQYSLLVILVKLNRRHFYLDDINVHLVVSRLFFTLRCIS